MDEQKVAQEQETQLEPKKETQVAAPIQFDWMNTKSLGAAYKAAQGLCSTSLIPEAYKNNPWSVMIAMEMASRTKFSLLHVMQNLYVIKGKPSWSGQFCAAAVNASGKFSPLQYVRLVNDDGSTNGYYCKATRLEDGVVCEGTAVTWDMVKGEDWYNKSGSKWKTMPDLMFHYRAAAFFCREHCPEVLCGLQTAEEVQDVKGYDSDQKEKVVISLD